MPRFAERAQPPEPASLMSPDGDLHDDDIAFDATLRERTRLADALHDGAMQEVIALRQNVKDATCDDEAQHEIDDGLQRVMTELRALTGALHEPSLDELSLRDAVGRIVTALKARNRLEITVDIDANTDRYNDPAVRETVRELTTNIAQHANASIATISISLEDHDLVLRIADDGSGFDPAEADAALAAGHIGLGRLRRLADRLGGTFDMRPAVPSGTIATVRLPAVGVDARGEPATG